MARNRIAQEDENDGSGALARRGLMKQAGLGLAGATALTALGTGSGLLTSSPAVALFNFALNFEYLGAEYYLRAVTGAGVAPGLTSGTGTQGTVTGGSLVRFQSPAVAYYAQRLANDELAHVRFIHDVLGAQAIAEPSIDLGMSWTTLAVSAGLIAPGQTFNPYASDLDFMLGAYVLEDVCVTLRHRSCGRRGATDGPHQCHLCGGPPWRRGLSSRRDPRLPIRYRRGRGDQRHLGATSEAFGRTR